MFINKLAKVAAVTVATGGLGAGLLVGATTPAQAAPVDVDLTYTCPFPVLGDTSVGVNLTTNLPSKVVVGNTVAPAKVTTVNELPPNVSAGMALIGVTNVDGTAISTNVVTVGGKKVNVPVKVTIPNTPLPASGSFTVEATGKTPPMKLSSVGSGDISMAGLTMDLFARTADGNPVDFGPFGGEMNPDGSVHVVCTQDAGQDAKLTNLAVTKAGTKTAAKAPKSVKAGSPVKIAVTTKAVGSPLKPAGPVTVKLGKKVLAKGKVKNGKGTVTITKLVAKKFLKPGKKTLTVGYAGSPTTTASADKVKVTVKK